MDLGFVLKLANEAIVTLFMIALPILGVAMIVGLIISVFQTTTSIQEQTLTFVPKLIAIFIVVLVLGPWFLKVLMEYVIRLFNLIVYVAGTP